MSLTLKESDQVKSTIQLNFENTDMEIEIDYLLPDQYLLYLFLYTGIQYGESLIRRNQQTNSRKTPDCSNLPCKF